MMDFDSAFDKLIGHEGGYVNDPRDRGMETNFGISKRAYPNLDIKSLTLAQCKALYQRDYWAPAGCEALPDAMRLQVFDMAVNSGVRAAVKALQKACGETDDGVLGSLTLQAVQSMRTDRLVARFNGIRLAMLADLPTWPSFGRGWARRIADNLLEA